MNQPTPEQTYRRIVLAIDPASDYRAALKEALGLAARLEAELSALFVEDQNILDAARHPFVRRFTPGAGQWERFGLPDIESAFRAMADRVRREIEAAAARDRVRWSFAVTRGDPETEALSASNEADLVVLGAGQDPLQAEWRPVSLARLGTKPRRTVLVVRPAAPAATKVAVAYDGSTSGDRALLTALRLSAPDDVSVALLADDAKTARALEAAARNRVGDLATGVGFVTMPKASAADLCGLAARVGAGVLILGADNSLLTDAESTRRLDRVDCRVLVVR